MRATAADTLTLVTCPASKQLQSDQLANASAAAPFWYRVSCGIAKFPGRRGGRCLSRDGSSGHQRMDGRARNRLEGLWL